MTRNEHAEQLHHHYHTLRLNIADYRYYMSKPGHEQFIPGARHRVRHQITAIRQLRTFLDLHSEATDPFFKSAAFNTF